MKRLLSSLCIFAMLFMLLPSAALAESYYMKYNTKVYSAPSAQAGVKGIIAQKTQISLYGSTNDDWQEVAAGSLRGWIYIGGKAGWSVVEPDAGGVWDEYLKDQSTYDATGYDQSQHFMQIVIDVNGKQTSSSNGLLGAVELSRVTVPRDMTPLKVYAKNSAASGVVYTLEGDEAFKIIRHGGDYNHATNTGYLYIVTQNGTRGFVLAQDTAAQIGYTAYGKYETWYAAAGDAVMYTYPSTAFGSLSSFGEGTAIQVMGEYSDEWVYGKVDGVKHIGWFQRASLTQTQNTSQGTAAYVIDKMYDYGVSDYIWMHAEPNYDSRYIELLYSGTKVTVISQENGWSYCHANGFAGYIDSERLSTTAPSKETITVPADTVMYPKGTVSLYKDTSESSGTYGTIAAGKALTIGYIRDGWAYTDAMIGGKSCFGYVKLSQLETRESYFEQLESTGQLVLGANERLLYVDAPGGSAGQYSTMSGTGAPIAAYQNGACLKGALLTPEWAYVTALDGVGGYMQAQYLRTAEGVRLNELDNAQENGAESENSAGNVTVQEYWTVQTGNDGRLNLRASADSNGKLINTYSNGTKVKVLSISGDWADVVVGDTRGFMMVKFLQKPDGTKVEDTTAETPKPEETPDSVGRYVVETGNDGRLHLRKKASSGAKSLGLYENGTMATVQYVTGQWGYVTVNGKTGYMMMKFLKPYTASEEKPDESAPETDAPAMDAPSTQQPPQQESSVTTLYVQTGNEGRLHLRKKASTGSKSLGLYENGTAVTVLENQGGWVRVTVNGKTGYMKTSFLTVSAPAQKDEMQTAPPVEENTPPAQENGTTAEGTTYYVKTGNDGRLHLREKNDSLSKSLGLFENGTSVTVHEKIGAWVRVTVNGQTGFMKFKFLDVTP